MFKELSCLLSPGRIRHAIYVAAVHTLSVGVLSGMTVLNANAQQVSAPTTSWTAIAYGNAFATDPSLDQQTGSPEGDFVGDAANPTLYTAFDKGIIGDSTDGTLFFRGRVGGDSNAAGFNRTFFVGIDAGRSVTGGVLQASGKLDLFVGVGNQGSGDGVKIWDPGTASNTSPSTTSVGGSPISTVALSAVNFNFAQVTATNNPGVTNTNIDGGKNDPDFFVSFGVSFSSVRTALLARGFTTINDTTNLRFVLINATQDNSLNQDFGNINDRTANLTQTYEQLGVISNAYNPATGTFQPVPATPAAISLGIGSLIGLLSTGVDKLRTRRRKLAAKKA